MLCTTRYRSIELNKMLNEEIFLLEPWIFSGTIRQNILFGLDYDPQKFNRCIHLAALNTVRIF